MFASPWWGLGVAAAMAAAMAAHLLSRRGGRRVMFPAVRFVIASQAEATRWRRLRHWAVMLLRATAVGLIALAFMQPRWQSPTAAGVDARAGDHVVIVVDRTVSMQRSVRGAMLFDEARRRAIELLQAVDPVRDRASVVLLDARPTLLLPEPTGRQDALIARLREVEVTYEHGRMGEAMVRAGEAHRRLADDPPRALRVEVFGDAQATQWSDQATARLPAGAAVRYHAIEGPTDNVAVGRVRVSPAQPVVGQSATVMGEVSNYGPAAVSATVALRVGGDDDAGDEADRRVVSVELDGDGGRATVSFEVVFDEAGLQEVVVDRVGADDALAADDRAGVFVYVRAARAVHLLTRGDVDDASGAAYFVSRALRPSGRDDDENDARRLTGVALTVGSPSALTAAIDRDAVVLLVEAGALSSAERAGLAAHLRRGGGVMWVVDDAAALRSAGLLSEQVTLPMLPTDEADPPDAAGAWGGRRFGAGRFDHDVLAVFEGPARAALLRSRLGRTWAGTLAGDATGLVYFADGSPAVAWGVVDEGRLAMVAGSLSPGEGGGDFVRGPAMAPLVHQLVRHLSPGAAGAVEVHPGGASDPGGRPGGYVVREGEGGGPTDGVRGLRGRDRASDGGEDEVVVGGVWVTVEPGASDLRPVGAERVAELDGRVVGGPTDAVRGLRGWDDGRAGVELWMWCVVAGLVLLAVEGMWVGRGGVR
ncbi:BatA and WFA domain-containing protein [Phycisphaerales bacterium AB-hyl4]|uniref:BatA and WFA domain-containing protein n=1 Tax=Natronomicrosphaera hydrolytica TaxID=3242702 RepID=A0ABV4TZY4_9BACT